MTLIYYPEAEPIANAELPNTHTTTSLLSWITWFLTEYAFDLNMIPHNLPPVGCADLLTITYFLHLICE